MRNRRCQFNCFYINPFSFTIYNSFSHICIVLSVFQNSTPQIHGYTQKHEEKERSERVRDTGKKEEI